MDKFKEIKDILENRQVVQKYLGTPSKSSFKGDCIYLHLEKKKQLVYMFQIKEYTILEVVSIMTLLIL